MKGIETISIRELVLNGEAELTTGPFGTQLKAAEYVESGVPLINVRNVGFGQVRADNLEYLSDETAIRLARHKLEPGDIVFGRKGAVERHAFISAAQVGWVQGSDCIRLRLSSGRLMPRFVSYFMLTDRHQQWMKNHCSGAATMASLNQEILGRIDIPLVELPIQRKIAAVLGAYDDLIENSGRRIKVLEEMAQRVYREWFVNFRYPGHDGVPMGDSELGLIPDGWKVGTIGEVLEVMESGSRPKGGIDPTERGVPSVGAENILGLGRYDFGREKFVSTSFFEQMRRGRVVNGDVVLYKDGAYIGRVSLFRDGFPHDECAVNEHVFILRTNTHFSQSMMYFWLADPGNQDRVRSLNANSAQPGINQAKLRSLTLVTPPPDFVKHFTERVEPILAMLFNLARSLPLLKNARDLLLPRLISGEIDVSDFDIMMPSEAA